LNENIDIFKNNEFREIRVFDYGSIPEQWIARARVFVDELLDFVEELFV